MRYRRESSRGEWKRAVLASVLLTWAAACAGVPGTRPTYRVVSTERIGPLLDVRLEWTSRASAVSSDARLSLLFESADACTEMIAVGTELHYVPGGQTGSLRLGETSCDAVGISELLEWRNRRPRRRIARPGDDRAQATYRVVFEHTEYAIIRGRFPLASMIGWYGGEDTLALIPRREECVRVLEREIASMEFRDAGPIPLLLIGDGRCPIGGFARVVPALRDQT